MIISTCPDGCSSSLDLSGNKANPARDANDKTSKHHVVVYTADVIGAQGFTRGALLLFALLSGGDYHSVNNLYLFSLMDAKGSFLGRP